MYKIEVQYFEGCQNSQEMINRVKDAIRKTNLSIEYSEILVDTPEKAKNYKFRGSPTVLVNGNDLEGLPEPKEGNLSCRIYKNGIPSVETIINKIENSSNEEA